MPGDSKERSEAVRELLHQFETGHLPLMVFMREAGELRKDGFDHCPD